MACEKNEKCLNDLISVLDTIRPLPKRLGVDKVEEIFKKLCQPISTVKSNKLIASLTARFEKELATLFTKQLGYPLQDWTAISNCFGYESMQFGLPNIKGIIRQYINDRLKINRITNFCLQLTAWDDTTCSLHSVDCLSSALRWATTPTGCIDSPFDKSKNLKVVELVRAVKQGDEIIIPAQDGYAFTNDKLGSIFCKGLSIEKTDNKKTECSGLYTIEVFYVSIERGQRVALLDDKNTPLQYSIRYKNVEELNQWIAQTVNTLKELIKTEYVASIQYCAEILEVAVSNRAKTISETKSALSKIQDGGGINEISPLALTVWRTIYNIIGLTWWNAKKPPPGRLPCSASADKLLQNANSRLEQWAMNQSALGECVKSLINEKVPIPDPERLLIAKGDANGGYWREGPLNDGIVSIGLEEGGTVFNFPIGENLPANYATARNFIASLDDGQPFLEKGNGQCDDIMITRVEVIALDVVPALENGRGRVEIDYKFKPSMLWSRTATQLAPLCQRGAIWEAMGKLTKLLNATRTPMCLTSIFESTYEDWMPGIKPEMQAIGKGGSCEYVFPNPNLASQKIGDTDDVGPNQCYIYPTIPTVQQQDDIFISALTFLELLKLAIPTVGGWGLAYKPTIDALVERIKKEIDSVCS